MTLIKSSLCHCHFFNVLICNVEKPYIDKETSCWAEMDVLSRQYILQIVPVISPFCLSHYEVEEGCLTGGGTSHQVRSHCVVDGTICKSVLSESLCWTPKSAMSASRQPISRHLLYPWCPLTSSSWLLIHIHAFFLISLTHAHTHGFMKLDILWRVI